MPNLSVYPGALDALKDDHKDKVNEPVDANDINAMAAAIMQVQQTLGIDPEKGSLPAGLFLTVVARLNAMDNPGLNTQTAANYTLQLTDFSAIVNMSSATAQTVTVPPNSSVPFPLRTSITVRADGIGIVSFAGGSGVTLNARGGATHIAGQYGYAVLIQNALDNWDLIGDIA